MNALQRLRRQIGERIVMVVAIAVLVYTFVPVAVVMAMSFNESPSKRVYRFGRFTWDNWAQLCAPEGMCSAILRSLEIGVLATVIATLIGTLMAFALERHRFALRRTVELLVFLPMATPEIVLGSTLLSLFVALGFSDRLGFLTILVSHVLFCISFVVVAVRARLAGMDRALEEAAMDLYASEWRTFLEITLPRVLPGIVGAALLAFSLSFDDLIVTTLNAGTTTTFPMFVWGSAAREIPGQINVIATLMFLLALAVVLAGGWRRGQPAS